MKLYYYYRAQVEGNYSIENVFSAVSDSLREKKIAIKNFYTGRQIDFRSILKVRKHEADIHHITGAVNYLALGLPARNTVLTVHDLGFYENPVNAGIKKLIYEYLWFRLPIQKVRAITTVSQFTKNRLIEHFKIESDKVKVIPNPIASYFKSYPSNPPRERFKILQIGTGLHKNLQSLVTACRELPVELIIVGRPAKGEIEWMDKLHIRYNVHFDLNKEELLQLYIACDILFFASNYEGFGMPIIESQKVGRPVITSNWGAMKEISGNSAYLVDPASTEEIRFAIIELINKRPLYNSLVEMGFENVKRFSLDRVSNGYLNLYKSLI